MIRNIICAAILFLMLFISYLSYSSLPDMLAMRYTLDGVGYQYVTKNVATIFLPTTYLACILLTVLYVKLRPTKLNLDNSTFATKEAIIAIGVLMLGYHYANLTQYHEMAENMAGCQTKVCSIALFFIISSNFWGKIEPNYLFGCKLPWTLASTNNWRLTHRLIAKVSAVTGILLLLTTLIYPSFYICLVALLLFVLIPSFYSYWLFRYRGI
ncbi:SdpI family protein [Vibrio neonatus]|uniref:SdpI family protein n=2 Tax=Vibrio neonatus TaxID=278860 RepID=UPI0039F049C9